MTLNPNPELTARPGAPRLIYRKPDVLLDRSTHYCPGCGHGIVHRLLAEVMTELDLPAHTIAVAPVGCAVFAYDYLNVDFVEAPHGRAPAVATGIRRVRPEAFVLTYQGDGDLAAIGTAEIVHAAARGERITAIFVNNGIYGMTGGQMAPTTLLGQRTTSSPNGRDAALMGYPIRITEMLAQLPGVTYAARGSIADASLIGKLKAMIKRACLVQIEGGGFALVEALSNCPVGWGMTPQESLEHLKGPVVEAYPLGRHRGSRGRGRWPRPVPRPRRPRPAPRPSRRPEMERSVDLLRLRRPGPALHRPGPRPRRDQGWAGGLLDPFIRSGDAGRHGLLHGHRGGSSDRLPGRRSVRRRGGDEPAVAAQVRSDAWLRAGC